MQSFYHEFKGVLGADCEVKKRGAKIDTICYRALFNYIFITANYIKEIMQNQINKYNLKQNNIKPIIINNAKFQNH